MKTVATFPIGQSTADDSTKDTGTGECVQSKRKRSHVHWGDESHSESSSRLVVERIGAFLTPSSEMTKREIATRWYLREEYETQGSLASSVAAGIRDSEGDGYVGTVEKVYKSCLGSLGPSDLYVQKLAHWTRVAHSRRGLERWSVMGIDKHRRHRRKTLVRTILDLQREPSMAKIDARQREEVFRICSERGSQAERRFALIMGHADAVAASNTVRPKFTMFEDTAKRCIQPATQSRPLHSQ